MKMSRACAPLLGLCVAMVAVQVASADRSAPPGHLPSPLPYQEQIGSLPRLLQNLVVIVGYLLADLGLPLSLAIAAALKFVILLLHVIGIFLGKEPAVSGYIGQMNAVSGQVHAASPAHEKGLLDFLTQKILELLKCILGGVSHILEGLLSPDHFGNQKGGGGGGLLGLVRSIL